MSMMRMMLVSLAMLSTASISSDGLVDGDVSISEEAALVSREAKWANADRITFVDEYSLFNSGVAKLQVGKPVTVYATINYSGDSDPISQSVVSFENVDPALSIDYDGTLLFDGKQAAFSFTVTLLESIQAPKLFSVRVSDGQPEDNQHLTPYSQRQTVIEDALFKDPITESSSEPEIETSTDNTEEQESDSSTPPNEEPKVENSTETSEEPPMDNSSEPVEKPEDSTNSSEENEIDSSTEPSQESSLESSSNSSDDKPKNETSTETKETSTRDSEPPSKVKGSSEAMGTKTSVGTGNTGYTKGISEKRKKSSFPSTGDNTKNRLFTMGIFITAAALLIFLYTSNKEKK
ncbi:peptidase [Enterococcus sp. BWM-S5]|uniref:Peptidase n=1 Tax=Enterococcus larvae TaxID=2794352 RepID=A0ABS4CN54_9ENTE|nr:peptidase [Enterococcus larvae]MBP1047407.1 peptidase [Enterococcus larvae]